MKKIIGIVLILAAAVGIFMAIWSNHVSVQRDISRKLSLDISKGTVITASDSHGGFHGDGIRFVILRFEEDTLKAQIAQRGDWKPLPLNEELTTLLYGREDENRKEGPYLSDKEGNTLLPHIANGYYYFSDRHPVKDTGIFDRGSFNYTAAVYDADTDTLYYAEMDT